MRNAIALVIAAALLAAAPAAAQMRPAPNLAARAPALRVPYRSGSYIPRGQVPRARVVFIPPPAAASRPGRIVATRIPSTSSATSSPSQSSVVPADSAGTPIPLGQLLNPVPGLGFDYTHLNAVNGNLAVRAFIDPVTEHELALAEQLPRQQPLGFFPGAGYSEEVPAELGAPQPEVIVVQQPEAQPSEAAPAASSATAAVAAPATPAPPPLNVGTFVLVRRDGKVLQAIGFSQQGGQVVYITADGIRHSMPLDSLNIAATERRNAERGTFLHLSQ